MSAYLVTYEGRHYANAELYYTAVAHGERSFMRLLSDKKAEHIKLLDEYLYELKSADKALCEKCNPVVQNFDDEFKRLNIVRNGEYKDAHTIKLHKEFIPEVYKYKQFNFIKVRDFYLSNKYRILPRLACVKLYSCLYVAVNAVNISAEPPVVLTVI